MTTDSHRVVLLPDARLEVHLAGGEAFGPVVCAAHPVDLFGAATAQLLAEQTHTKTVCINPRQPDEHLLSLESMVDRIETARRMFGISRWIFWGMSGGGWLAQLYAHRHPDALLGIVVESSCLCFAERLDDPQCALSPRFPAWRAPLEKLGLLGEERAKLPDFDGEWLDVEGAGQVFRQRGGRAILVSPMPLDAAMLAAMPQLLRFDARPFAATLRTPTLVLAGTADPVAPLHRARAVAEAIPGATFVAIEGGGHVPSATKHEAVARAFAEFMSRLPHEA
jgi:pimeloyl-ACP methyl ester carboxylesterase